MGTCCLPGLPRHPGSSTHVTGRKQVPKRAGDMRLGGKKQYWNSSIPTSLTHTNIATYVHMPGLQAELTHPCSHANTDIMAITHASIWIQLQLLLPETSSALKASLMLHTMAIAMWGERQLQRTAAQGAFQGSTETVGTPRAKRDHFVSHRCEQHEPWCPRSSLEKEAEQAHSYTVPLSGPLEGHLSPAELHQPPGPDCFLEFTHRTQD